MKLIATGLLAFGLSLAASAQDTSRDAELITAIDKESIRYVIESAGYTVTEEMVSGIGIIGEDTNGIKFGLTGTFCRADNICPGLHMFVSFDDVGTAIYANKINSRYSAVQASALDDFLLVSRYLILDHGQTLQNVRKNLTVLQSIALTIKNHDSSAIYAADSIAWGDDSGQYAKDSECDDARFHANGDDTPYKRQHVLHDATDCRTAFEWESAQLYLDFGDNSGRYANDDECDDSRFTGKGRSGITSDSHVKRDSADCIAAYRAERLNRP